MKVLWTSLFVLGLSGAALACTDGDTAAIDGKCREYQVCQNGSWVKDSCNTPLRKYSKEQKKCMWWFQVDCEESSQCSEEGELLKNPYTCSSYYKCESGKLISHSCIWPFYFDGTGCKFWASCDSGVSVGGSRDNQKERYADPCSGEEDEPIANHCFWYKTCGKDSFFQQTRCTVGKYFNVETKTCEWFWKVDCSISSCDGKARAPENSDGKNYYQCVNSFLMKKTCGALQKFDAEKERCVFTSPFSAVQLESLRKSVANVTDLANDTDVQRVAEMLSNLAQQEPNTVPTTTGKAPSSDLVASNSSVLLRRLRRSTCTSGAYSVDPDCLAFKVCVNGGWVSKRCPMGMIFSNNQCRFFWEATCDPASCIAGKDTAYPQDCTKYYHCDGNYNKVLTNCPSGLKFIYTYHFNPSTLQCEKALYWSSCPSSSSYLATCSEGDTKEGGNVREFQLCRGNQWTTVKCDGGDIYVKQLRSCGCPQEAAHAPAFNKSQYLECQGGRWIQLDCLLGGVYNPETKMCEKKTKSKRSAGNNPDDCISGDSKYDDITGACSSYMFCTEEGRWARRACPKGQYFNGRGSCSETPCPYEAVPGNCEAFKLSNGTVVNCDFGMRFDKITKQCVLYALAHCADIECEGLELKNHPASCKQYLQCNDQQWTVQDCGWFRNKFDMRSRKCVFGWWGHAATCRYDPAECSDGSVKPTGSNCREYVTCTNKTERESSCFWPMKFDSESLRCVWWGAKCL